MPDYGSFCPVALGTEVFADRWTPLVIRQLVLGDTRFNDIARGLPGISRSLLVQRLRHLEKRGVVELWPSPTGRGNEYRLTPAGKDLGEVVISLGRWAVHWLFDELDPGDIDAVTLTWFMHRNVDAEALPPARLVIEFRHQAPERIVIWMVLDRGEASVCVQHPGFDPDLVISASTPTLGQVFSGRRSWKDAIRDGDVDAAGPPKLVAGLPRWFVGSPFTDDTKARLQASRS